MAAYYGKHSKNSCVGYIIEFSGFKLYHTGDTGLIDEMSDLANKNIDYALLSINGTYTIIPEETVKTADKIKAKCYIPIHTRTSLNTYSDPIVAMFTVVNKVVVLSGQTNDLNKSFIEK